MEGEGTDLLEKLETYHTFMRIPLLSTFINRLMFYLNYKLQIFLELASSVFMCFPKISSNFIK